MIIRGIGENGEWVFGAGKQNYPRDVLAIMVNLKTRLMVFQTECFWDNGAGLPWYTLLGAKDSAPLLLALRTKILETYGIVGIVALSYAIDTDRNLTVNYTVNTIYSAGVSGGFQL
jgi:hypothetical protein